MNYNPDRHHRQSIRLRGYDYSRAGTYFLTACVQNRECLFGEVADGEMRLNEAGRIVQTIWNELPSHYPGLQTDEFVVMPNHIHGIVVLPERYDGNQRNVGAQFIAPSNIAPPNISKGAMNRQGAMNREGAINRAPTLGAPIIAPSNIAPPNISKGAINREGAMNRAPTLGAPIIAPSNISKGAMNREGAINRAPTLGDVDRGFKARAAFAINRLRQSPGIPVWQRNYYEHIIRDDNSLNRIRKYIIDNPARWMSDREHPGNVEAPLVRSSSAECLTFVAASGGTTAHATSRGEKKS